MSSLIVPVVKIKELLKHPNAERLEIVSLENYDWNCVVQKDRFKPGDTAIYIPIDSILPPKLFNIIFPPDSMIRPDKGRIKAIKIRQYPSFGLVLTIDGLKQYYPELKDKQVGDDIKDLLGIKKYEPPEKEMPAGMKAEPRRSNNKWFSKYTDIENYKNFPDIFEDGEEVYISSKLHGTSFRAAWCPMTLDRWWKHILAWLKILPEQEFVYGSRNLQLQNKLNPKVYYKSNVYARAVVQYDLKNKLRANEAIFGEIVGGSIQSGYTYGCKKGEIKFFAYDVKVNGRYLSPNEFKMFCDEREIPRVPDLYNGPFSKDLLAKYAHCDDIDQLIREGIVIKPQKEQICIIGRKVLKYINPEYLMKSNTEWH